MAITTSLAPWLPIDNCTAAINFYKAAFDAVEAYRMEDPGGGLVVKLSVDGAEFWISGNTNETTANAKPLGDDTIRMVLTTSKPDELFNKAIAAGAKEIFPIGEEYGWRLGRVVDPFGLHWEIGHPLADH
jgi:PhnB protein